MILEAKKANIGSETRNLSSHCLNNNRVFLSVWLLLSIVLYASSAFSLNPTPIMQSGYYYSHSHLRNWDFLRWYSTPNVKVQVSSRVKLQKVKMSKFKSLFLHVLLVSFLFLICKLLRVRVMPSLFSLSHHTSTYLGRCACVYHRKCLYATSCFLELLGNW